MLTRISNIDSSPNRSLINKRSGFKSSFITRSNCSSTFAHTRNAEAFDTVYGTYPNNLYILTDNTGTFAICGENDNNYVFVKPINKKDKYQWLLVDADTGAVCFFTDLKNYMNITITNGQINVRRGDILKNGTFNFNSDHTLTIRGSPEYCLGFNKQTANENSVAPLEVINKSSADTSVYSIEWKFELVYNLRDLTNYIDTMEDIQQINASGDAQVSALQKIIENNKQQYQTELNYRDEKINRYESNWFVKWFLK